MRMKRDPELEYVCWAVSETLLRCPDPARRPAFIQWVFYWGRDGDRIADRTHAGDPESWSWHATPEKMAELDALDWKTIIATVRRRIPDSDIHRAARRGAFGIPRVPFMSTRSEMEYRQRLDESRARRSWEESFFG